MSTYRDSRFVTARKARNCQHVPAHEIREGDRYLRYKLGQRNDIAVCLACAPQYDCAVVREAFPNARH